MVLLKCWLYPQLFFSFLSPLFWLSPKCFSEALFWKEKTLSWFTRAGAEFIAASLAVAWGIMGKTGCISVTMKYFSDRWKGFCILFEFSLHKPVCIVIILFCWSFLFKTEHWTIKLLESLMSLHTECQGQMLLESETSGTGASVSPRWHFCMEFSLRQTRAIAQWVTNILGRD